MSPFNVINPLREFVSGSALDKKETFKEYLEIHVIDHVTSEEVKKRLRQETNRVGPL